MKNLARSLRRKEERLHEHATDGNADELKKLISERGISKKSCHRALRQAARNGHQECVRLLIPASEFNEEAPDALQDAAEGGMRNA